MITLLTQPTRRTRRQSLSWRPGKDLLPELHVQPQSETIHPIDDHVFNAAILGLVRDMTTLDKSYCAPVNSPLRQYPFPPSNLSQSLFTQLPSAHGYSPILGEI